MNQGWERRSVSNHNRESCRVLHSEDQLRNHSSYWNAYHADLEAFVRDLVPGCNCGIRPDFYDLEHLNSDAINFNTLRPVVNFSDGV